MGPVGLGFRASFGGLHFADRYGALRRASSVPWVGLLTFFWTLPELLGMIRGLKV